jgi:hypothetical protein
VGGLVSRGKTTAPAFKEEELQDEVQSLLVHLGAYAYSAEKTSSNWTNFSNQGNRPSQAKEIKSYVLTQIKAALCDPSLDSEIKKKNSQDGQNEASKNLTQLRSQAAQVLAPVFSTLELACPQGSEVSFGRTE